MLLTHPSDQIAENGTKMHAYLDHNASAPLLEGAKDAMLAALDFTGNPSSIHGAGRSARKIVEDSRRDLASICGIQPKQVVFTSGATEAAQLALGTSIRFGSSRVRFSHLYISSVEHPCILAGGRFGPDEVTKFGVDGDGRVDLDELEKVLQLHDASTGVPLVAVMHANNETGIVQPIEEIGEIVKANGGYFCVDAVQSFGKLPVDLASFNAHFIIVSAHKIGGPKGAGALLMMHESIFPDPLIRGGGQENLLRSGTENVAAIAGFGAAAVIADQNLDQATQIKAMRDHIEVGIEEISRQSSNNTPLPIVFGIGQPRLPNTSCFAVEGIKAENALIALDLKNISVSSGSACSSGRVNQSHVLSAMGVSPQTAECALRVSVGHQTTRAEADYFLNAWQNIVEHRA